MKTFDNPIFVPYCKRRQLFYNRVGGDTRLFNIFPYSNMKKCVQFVSKPLFVDHVQGSNGRSGRDDVMHTLPSVNLLYDDELHLVNGALKKN